MWNTIKEAIGRALTRKGGSWLRLRDADNKISGTAVLALVIRVAVIALGLVLIYWIGGALGLNVGQMAKQFLSIFGVVGSPL